MKLKINRYIQKLTVRNYSDIVFNNYKHRKLKEKLMKKAFILFFALSTLFSIPQMQAMDWPVGPSVAPAIDQGEEAEVAAREKAAQIYIRLQQEIELDRKRTERLEVLYGIQNQMIAAKDDLIAILSASCKGLQEKNVLFSEYMRKFQKNSIQSMNLKAQKGQNQRFFLVHLPSLLAGCVLGGIAVFAFYKFKAS